MAQLVKEVSYGLEGQRRVLAIKDLRMVSEVFKNKLQIFQKQELKLVTHRSLNLVVQRIMKKEEN